ncbi:MAG: sensor histidine kinase, partial [Nitrospirae bacterium]
ESLSEKELLLHEIHHRVKNNMQVITSLLDLQLGYLENKDPRELFSDIKNRIRTMSLVHEKLYLAKDLSHVDFSDYIATLVSNLYKFNNLGQDRIALRLDIEDISLGIDTAIPCGLIVNELITNALKYAFPGERTGEIQVRLRVLEAASDAGAEYELTVSDNGVGIPESLDLNQVKSLGLYLVTTLARHQLQGTVQLNRTGGTGFVISFRELKGRKRV